MSPIFDSADLLQRCKDKTKIPSPSEDMDDPSWYRLLTEAQIFWVKKMSATKPEVNYGPPVKMTSADGGYTYTFGADADGRNITPLGHAEIRETRSGRLWIPSTDWQTRDFVMEGDQIRLPNGKNRVMTDGPWARFVTDPVGSPIDGTHQPILKPISARILLVNRACILYALQGGKRDPSPYEAEENSNWDAIVEALATQFFLSGAQAVDEDTGFAGFMGYAGDNPADYTRTG